ncbi:MAG: ferrochelatase [Patescibacteria group bacterium]|jgi:ferrochelatase
MSIKKKTGILLVNLGTPDDPSRWAVYRYLKEFLADPRVIDVTFVRKILIPLIIIFRSKESSEGYKDLWMEEGSPLKVYGNRLTDGVRKILGTEDYQVELAMRYQNPSIESVIKKLMDAKVTELVVLPLFPHYASASTGSVQEEVMRVLATYWTMPKLTMIDHFYDYEPMIDLFVQRGRDYDYRKYDHILFSYHGLPERHMAKTDDTCSHCLTPGCCDTLSEKNQMCYTAHCAATTRAIVAKLELTPDQYTMCYQSRLGRDPWVKPYTSDVIEEQAELGRKNILVFCPAFVCDCLETTIEISDEYQELFEEKGGEKLQLVEGLNDDPRWIKAVADLVRG